MELADEEGTEQHKRNGLLRFFGKGTREDLDAYLKCEDEKWTDAVENDAFGARIAELEKQTHSKALARVRQQRHRAKVKNIEISNGCRSPGGTKRKVRL